jgi:octaprenyl-diphosphate synthase
MRSWNAQWDNHTAVLGGDYLVARAIALLGESYDECSVIVNAIDSVRMMAEGEMTNFGHGAASREACISLAKKKTASLFSVTCSTPSYLLDPSGRDALHEYGLVVGIAFQLVDDVLDLVQSKETLGKPSCNDITEGKKTLPLLHLREAMSVHDQARLDSLQGSDVPPADCDWIADMMERTGAREQTESLARSYCDQARHLLEPFSPSPYRDAMTGLTEFVISRDW